MLIQQIKQLDTASIVAIIGIILSAIGWIGVILPNFGITNPHSAMMFLIPLGGILAITGVCIDKLSNHPPMPSN